MAELASRVSGMVAASMWSPCAAHSAAMASASARVGKASTTFAGVRSGLQSSSTLKAGAVFSLPRGKLFLRQDGEGSAPGRRSRPCRSAWAGSARTALTVGGRGLAAVVSAGSCGHIPDRGRECRSSRMACRRLYHPATLLSEVLANGRAFGTGSSDERHTMAKFAGANNISVAPRGARRGNG